MPTMTFMTCSITRIVIPRALIARISSIASSTSAPLRPAITSSRSSRRGSIASAFASSSRLRPPIGKLEAGASRWGSRWTSPRIASAFSIACRAVRLPPPAPYIAPTATFSRTVRFAKGRTTRNVRAIPIRPMTCGFRPLRRRPSKVIVPVVGANVPVIRLTRVVLPAPLGPIRPTISFWRRSKLTPCTATTPPNRRLTPSTRSTTSSGIGASGLPTGEAAPQQISARRGAALHEHQDAARHEQHDQDDEQREDGGLPLEHGIAAGEYPQQLAKREQHEGAHPRPPDRPDPADQADDDQLEVIGGAEQRLGFGGHVGQAVADRGAAKGSQRGAQHVGEHLGAPCVDAHRLGGLLVLADRHQPVAERAATHHHRQPPADHGGRQG